MIIVNKITISVNHYYFVKKQLYFIVHSKKNNKKCFWFYDEGLFVEQIFILAWNLMPFQNKSSAKMIKIIEYVKCKLYTILKLISIVKYIFNQCKIQRESQ